MNIDIGNVSWIDWIVIGRGHPDGKVVVNMRCRCGRLCSTHKDDSEGFYCRRHGLQGYIKKPDEQVADV